jgi:hypothetical protein
LFYLEYISLLSSCNNCELSKGSFAFSALVLCTHVHSTCYYCWSDFRFFFSVRVTLACVPCSVAHRSPFCHRRRPMLRDWRKKWRHIFPNSFVPVLRTGIQKLIGSTTHGRIPIDSATALSCLRYSGLYDAVQDTVQ